MNLTLTVKLLPTPEQRDAMLATMRAFNAACDHIAGVAFEQRSANKIALQKIVYRDVREMFGLSAQLAIRAIAKVCEVYKLNKAIKPKFRPLGAIVYDQRSLSWRRIDRVSLLTVSGREIIPAAMGQYNLARFDRARGQADLVYRDGEFFLHVVVDVPIPPEGIVSDFLGVDLGHKNIAADSDGDTFSGAHNASLRARHANLRRKLQQKGTKSAIRLLKRRRARERRFAADLNHCISKSIVRKAKGTGRGIALEDLKGIRDRITVPKPQRRAHHGWAFHQLRLFVTYKAALLGVPVVAVDPRDTSRQCPECGVVDKANRRTRDHFACQHCGHAALADLTAARNIAGRAAAMQPHAVAA